MPGLSELGALFAPVAARGSLGLAVSGGADSLALLLVASAWARSVMLKAGARLTVYCTRSRAAGQAANEAAFVAREAARLGLACRVLRWAGPKPISGVQAAARLARYRLIGEAMRLDGAEVLLTGHHRDDQAETVLMRLAHGSGLGGLRGMDSFAEVEGVRLFRPFLDVPRAALAEIVAAAGLVPVADPSNDDVHYERVRWRKAMPVIGSLGLDAAALTVFARRVGDADAAIAAWVDDVFGESVKIDGFGAALLPVETLPGLPRAVGVKLLGAILAMIGGAQRPHALAILERVYGRLTHEDDVRRLTTLGVALGRQGENFWFAREPGRQAPTPARREPRQSLLWDRRFRIDNSGDLAVEIQMARALSRRQAEGLIGQRIVAPALAIRSAPLVQGGDGRLLALGAHRFDDSVTVAFAGEYRGVTAN